MDTGETRGLIIAVERHDLTMLMSEISSKNFSQDDIYQAFIVCLYGFPGDYQKQKEFSLPLLGIMDSADYLPGNEWNPLINCAIENSGCPEDGYDPWILQELIVKGANPNDTRLWPPLVNAIDIECDSFSQQQVSEGQPDTVLIRILLENGANPSLKDSNGRDAFDVAKSYGYANVINILEFYRSRKGGSHGL